MCFNLMEKTSNTASIVHVGFKPSSHLLRQGAYCRKCPHMWRLLTAEQGSCYSFDAARSYEIRCKPTDIMIQAFRHPSALSH